MTICNYLKCISSKFSVNTKFKSMHSQESLLKKAQGKIASLRLDKPGDKNQKHLRIDYRISRVY